MSKSDIAQQVARKFYMYYDRYSYAVRQQLNKDVNRLLTAAGHFDLLAERDVLLKVVEAARDVINNMSNAKYWDSIDKLRQVLLEIDS